MNSRNNGDKHMFSPDKGVLTKTALDIPEILSGDYWTELRVFLAVAKGQSFARASEILKVSSKTVTRHVRRLQDVLGSELVESTKHGTVLTAQGFELANQLAELDYRLFNISQQIKSQKNEIKSFVRIGVTDALGAFFVSPSLFQFTREHEDIGINIRTLINANDLRENSVDLMISPIPMPGTDLAVERGGTIHFVAMASGHYTSIYGQPNPDNLEDHWFVQSDFYETEYWNEWRRLVERGLIRAKTDSNISYGTMVKTGLGIGLLASFMSVDPMLKPLSLDIHYTAPLFVISLKEQLSKQHVRTVRNWLLNLFSAQNPWFADTLNLDVGKNEYDFGIRRMLNV